MIKKFSFGKVFRTESVPVSLEAQSGPMPFVAVDEQEMSFTYRMDPQDVVYGLGENVRGINKRGWIYEIPRSGRKGDLRALYRLSRHSDF